MNSRLEIRLDDALDPAPPEPRLFLRFERKRMLAVRNTLTDELEQSPANPPLVQACAEYLVSAQERLIAQDMRLAHRILETLPADEVENRQGPESLLERLNAAQPVWASYRDRVAELADDSADGPALAQASREFVDGTARALAGKRHTLSELTARLLTDQDWANIADRSTAAVDREKQLFNNCLAARQSS